MGVFWGSGGFDIKLADIMKGGARSGAGRPAGSQNVDTAAARQALADLAGGHVAIALAALADIAENGQSEAARVSAACALLDRCYGRPALAPAQANTDESLKPQRIIICAAGEA